VKTFPNLPTPRELFRAFDNGSLPRGDFQRIMAEHARLLIEEMEDMHHNPLAAAIERMRNRTAGARLARRIGDGTLRQILTILGAMDDFPPAQILWNANQLDMPLHCFFRTKHEPIFRILQLDLQASFAKITVEYGSAKKGESTREEITLQKNRLNQFEFVRRVKI
jgi:hypothetical protein